MLKYCTGFLLAVILALTCASSAVLASESGGNDATVTVIQGTARVYSKKAPEGRILKKGDALHKEHEIRVAEKSRMEVRFADGSVMRFSGKSRIKMGELAFNKQDNAKKVKVDLTVGKLWANVKKLGTSDSSVEVRTSNAVAGVRGTVYQVNVEDDQSALVKVYDGSVAVASPPRDASKSAEKTAAPHEVPGPHAVPPPYHEVSREEWTAIVKAMQQITISSQGIPSKPQDFDPKADTDDWVQWNQQRDRETSF